MADTRPANEREQIKFTLLSGKGSFALMEVPDKTVKNELTASPSSRGFVTVLFYPSGVGDYSLKVVPINNKGLKGELNYNFPCQFI